MANAGVHAAHCCKIHGCKYGESDCPVVLEKVEAKYSCEWCQEEREVMDACMKKAVELGLFEETPENFDKLRKVIYLANRIGM